MKAKYNNIELEGTPEEIAVILKELIPVINIHVAGIGLNSREVADRIVKDLQKATSFSV